jgi:hypothetical protein
MWRVSPGHILLWPRFAWLQAPLATLLLYNWHSSHPNLLFFSPESTPGNKIDNQSISTTHPRQIHDKSIVSPDEILTIVTIRTVTDDVQSKRQ